MPVLVNKQNPEIILAPKTLEELEEFFAILEGTHIHPNPDKMATLYDVNVCAVETKMVFQGRDHLVAGLKYLFEIIEFVSFEGELKTAGENGEIVWVYVHYPLTKLRSKSDGKDWSAMDTRCTYVLKKTSHGLRIVQNHCSEPVKYS